jgi:hypothetical protein
MVDCRCVLQPDRALPSMRAVCLGNILKMAKSNRGFVNGQGEGREILLIADKLTYML